MHIMMIPSWYSSSENQVHGSFFKEQFIGMERSGVKVTVAYNEIWPLTKILSKKEQRGISVNVEDGLKTYRYKDFNYYPKNPRMFKSFNKRMEKLYLEIVKNEGPIQVIHAHSSLWGGIAASYVAKKYNIPLVITEHSSLSLGNIIKDSYIPYIIESYNSCDGLIAVGNGLKKELNEFTDSPVRVIPNLVNFSEFIKRDMPHKGTRLFSLGYLVKEKGMDSLIRAFTKEFKEEEVFLTIGGDGVERENLERLIKDLGMEKQIEIKGLLSRLEVVDEMNKCDGFVLASHYETFGVVYIEALSLGKPVLGTENGGAEDIINSFNGILVKNKDEDELGKALKIFVDKLPSYDCNKIITNAKKRYSEEIIINEIKNVYEEVIEGRK